MSDEIILNAEAAAVPAAASIAEEDIDFRRWIPSYRTLIYMGTFISGAVALVFQVVWQRYLSFLVGSEARSISLVVAVFLLGLAAGYRFWGNVTQRRRAPGWSRQTGLRILGYIELGIAAYGLAFPYYFALVQKAAHVGPDALVVDLIVSGLLLLAPTFLMGASIPLLTAVVPATPAEVHDVHARIYGINTLGAFFGALLGGLYLAPRLGLPMALLLGSIANIGVGLLFIVNRLEANVHKAQDIPLVPNAFGSSGIYLYVFVTGAVSIGLEVLFARVVSLTVGSGYFVFPIVVGVVILGLAIGSLSLRRVGMSAARVPSELLKLSVILCIVYMTIPYWPYWLSHVRVSMARLPSNHDVFLISVLLFLALFLLPIVIPIGRLLPLGYALIDKNRADYGRVCGRVYFTNTLGTVVGAVGIGYAMFAVLSLPNLFKLNIMLLLALGAWLSFRSGWQRRGFTCAIAAGLVLVLPGWNRTSHILGLFRFITPQEYHSKGLFHIPDPQMPTTLHLLRDDPMMTVAAYSYSAPHQHTGKLILTKTLAVNAKADGNTIGDYSTVMLMGLIPYFYATGTHGLSAAVVGMGTGMTSGALAAAEDVESVTTLEISEGVLEALDFFEPENLHIKSHPKSKIIQTDAFRFFSRTDEKFDMIVSEPSNPWVVGVENLFTPEFYRLVNGALADDGVFFQWIQLYENNNEIMAAIAANLLTEFPHASMYLIGRNDLGILASRAPLDRKHMSRRANEPAVRALLEPMGIDDPILFSMLEVYRTPHLKALASAYDQLPHSVEYPWMSQAASRAKFMQSVVRLRDEVFQDVGRHLPFDEQRAAEFALCVDTYQRDPQRWCGAHERRHGSQFMCGYLQVWSLHASAVRQTPTLENALSMLTGYSRLREQGFAQQNLELLEELRKVIEADGARIPAPQRLEIIAALAKEIAFEWEWRRALQTIKGFREQRLLSDQEYFQINNELADLLDRTKEHTRRAEESNS